MPSEIHNRLAVLDVTTLQVIPVGTGGLDRPYSRQFDNFAPRAGIVWDPFGRGKTVIRTGAGLYFDQPVTNVVTPLGNNPPFTNSVTFNNTPQAPLVIDPAAPFSLPGGVTGVPNINAVDPIFRSGRVLQYNFNIQHEALGTVFQAGYIGSQGRRLRLLRDVNQGVNSQRPLRQYGVINSNESSSRSSYNALWISANRRFSKGLTLHHVVHAGALHGSQFRGSSNS